MPAEALAQQTGLPAPIMQFVSLAEVAGGLGLLVPGAPADPPRAHPLAAAGLVLVMVGAVVLSAVRVSAEAAVMPFAVGVLLVVVARGRRGSVVSIS